MENAWKMWANIFQQLPTTSNNFQPASRPIEKEMRSTTGSRCVKQQHQAIGLAPEVGWDRLREPFLKKNIIIIIIIIY